MYCLGKEVPEEKFKKKILSLDSYKFPPCSREVEQQIRRTIYVTSLWNNAFQPNPTDLDPLDFGWCIQDQQMSCKWFDVDEMPETVLEMLNDNNTGKSVKILLCYTFLRSVQLKCA